ncbi:unnamed protein product [Chrysodeixis includens]|uniref:Uncharacterized protein n=1 Tax=Chrysodeixis includens TaxID=689277 RepID=A0A9N8KWH6_CHRIL|nr:unnamed protein product [Chrysodeixis includens]
MTDLCCIKRIADETLDHTSSAGGRGGQNIEGCKAVVDLLELLRLINHTNYVLGTVSRVQRSCLVLTLSVLLVLNVVNSFPSINYTWLKYSDKYDAIVGISHKKKPICSGVLVNKFSVITAANPIYIHVKYYNPNKRKLYVHAIAGAFNKAVVHMVERVTYQSRRDRYRRPFGFDSRHSPIHDIAILCLFEPMQTFTEVIFLDQPGPWGEATTIREIRYPEYAQRHYGMRPIIGVETFKSSGVFSIAGHGFVDKQHVKQNTDLEVVDYEVGAVLKDCDHWVPRGWGHYICLLNVENFVGIAAGSALFYNRRFIGIGSFSVLRDNDSILLFTDLRKYHGMKSWRSYIDILEDHTEFGFNPDDKLSGTITIIAIWMRDAALRCIVRCHTYTHICENIPLRGDGLAHLVQAIKFMLMWRKLDVDRSSIICILAVRGAGIASAGGGHRRAVRSPLAATLARLATTIRLESPERAARTALAPPAKLYSFVASE